MILAQHFNVDCSCSCSGPNLVGNSFFWAKIRGVFLSFHSRGVRPKSPVGTLYLEMWKPIKYLFRVYTSWEVGGDCVAKSDPRYNSFLMF